MAFEAILAHPPSSRRPWRRLTFAVSLGLHAVALLVGIGYSLWRVDEMPLPAIQVTLANAPPPPPPPPPPAGGHKATSKPKVRAPTKTELVQPKETPKESPKPETDDDEGQEEGQPGGVAGGVAGGVVGGVVGGVPGAPPPPRPKDTGPKIVTAAVGHHQLAINASVAPYCCPRIPRALDRSGATFSAEVRVCVSADGQVTDARVIRGAGPGIDPQIPEFVRRWRYHPLILEGHPTPFCYPFVYDATVR